MGFTGLFCGRLHIITLVFKQNKPFMYKKISTLLFLAVLIGFIDPWLFSAKSDLAVILAVFINLAVLVYFLKTLKGNLS